MPKLPLIVQQVCQPTDLPRTSSDHADRLPVSTHDAAFEPHGTSKRWLPAAGMAPPLSRGVTLGDGAVGTDPGHADAPASCLSPETLTGHLGHPE